MFKDIYSMKDLYNPLNGKKDEIINYFTSFFGEKYREKIKKKIEKIDILFCNVGQNQQDLYDDIHKENIHHLVENCLKDWQDKIGEYYDTYFCLSDKLLDNLKYWKDDLNVEGQYWIEIYDFIDRVFKIRPEEFDYLLKDDKFTAKLKEKLNTLNDIYQNDYKKDIDFYNDKFYQMSVLPWKDEIESIEKEFKDKWLNIFEESVYNRLMLKKSEEIKPVAEEIKSLFYNQYQNNQLLTEVYTYVIKKKLADIIDYDLDFKVKFFNMDLKFYNYDFNQDKNIANNKIYNLKNGVSSTIKALHDFDPSLDNSAFVMRSLVYGSGGMISSCCNKTQDKIFNFIRVDSPHELMDSVLIHELSHLVQMSYGEDKVRKTGIKAVPMDETIINYNPEMFLVGLNEVVNEFFTQLIMNNIKKDDFCIVDNKSTFDSLYLLIFPFLQDFLLENLEDIKECCMSEDYDLLYKYYGKQNLIKLEDLIAKIFDGFFYDEFKDVIKTFESHAEQEIKDRKWIDLAYDKSIDWDKMEGINKNIHKYLELMRNVDKVLKEMKNCKKQYDLQFEEQDEYCL